MSKELYQPKKMRPVTQGLLSAQYAIEAMIVQGEEENIFDYRGDNPELYKLYMDINELVGKSFELYDN